MVTTAVKRAYDPNAQVKATPYKVCAITPQQEREWETTRAATLFFAPMFAYLLYSMMNPKGTEHIAHFTKDIPIAATDGVNLLLNPDTFFALKLKERVFVVCHEVFHNVFDHCGLLHAFLKTMKVRLKNGKDMDFDPGQMNEAADYVINAILVDSTIGEMPKCGLYDTNIAKAEDAVIDIYKKIYKKGRGSKGGFDILLQPGAANGKDPNQAQSDRNKHEWDVAVAGAVSAAKAMGKLPAGLERAFGELLDPKISWQEHIQSLFARKVGGGGYDWRKPDRRMISRDDPIFCPQRSGFGAGTIVVAVDTSGSIGDAELNLFMPEISGILEDLRPKRIVLMWCDAAIGRIDEIEEPADLVTARGKGAPGGGGTAFEPVFKEIEDQGITNCDALVYFSDGYGSFPSRAPDYPVIWASIACQPEHYPFGDVVMVERS